MALAIPAPSSRMTDHNLRFSDVAQFVGLSLLRDPSAPRSKGKQRPKLTTSVQSGSGEFSYSQSYSSLPSASRDFAQKRSVHSESAPSLPKASKQSLGLSPDRAEQLKIQLGYVKAEQQAEQLMLKKLEHALSDSVLAERRAHDRVEKERERRDFHRERARRKEETINALQEELRAATQPPQAVQRRSTVKSEPVMSQESRELPPKPAAVQESHVEVIQKALPSPSEQQQRRKKPDDQPMKDLSPKAEVVGNQVELVANPDEVVGNQVELVATLDHASSSSSTGQGTMKKSRSESDVQRVDWSVFETDEERDDYRRTVIRDEMMKRAGNAVEAFAKINLNGSGRICSQEFADGVARLGVPWQMLTGLARPRQLFKLFDNNPTNGVISLYELFPTERNKIRDDSGMSTPDFWKKWVKKNRNMENGCGGPKWQPTGPEEELSILFDNRVKNEQSAFKHRWMSTTFRRMKARGKSDARCREMLALHLPRGSGPADRQDVKTFSQTEVKHCKRIYNEAVLEPQRQILKSLYSLREHRRVISTSRQKLYSVALEPLVRQKKQEAVAQDLQLGGLSLGLHKVAKMDHVESADEPLFEKPVDLTEGQASFKTLSRMTEMDVAMIEDVFRIWMKHADKSETIHKKQFERLLQDLCPQRNFAEADLELWWDQVHERRDAARLTVDWQASDPDSCEVDSNDGNRDSKEKDKITRELREIRKSPASFDQFIIWWSSSEVKASGAV